MPAHMLAYIEADVHNMVTNDKLRFIYGTTSCHHVLFNYESYTGTVLYPLGLGPTVYPMGYNDTFLFCFLWWWWYHRWLMIPCNKSSISFYDCPDASEILLQHIGLRSLCYHRETHRNINHVIRFRDVIKVIAFTNMIYSKHHNMRMNSTWNGNSRKRTK